MKLVLSYADTPLWADFLASWPGLPQLSELPTTLSAHAILSPVITPDQLTAMLQNSDISQLVVFFSQAEYSIAGQLQQGCSMEVACEHWVQQMTQLSALQRKNRQKVKLINLHQALQHPVVLQEQLQLLGLAAPTCDATRLPTTLELLLSCQTVRQHDSMQQLNTFLQASALPLADTEQLTLDLPQFQQQQDRISKAQQQESDLLLHQLQHVQEELEQLFQKKLDVKQKYQDLKADYDRELSELNGDLKLREATVQASQQQLTKLQQQLDRVTKEHNALQQQAAEKQNLQSERDFLLEQLFQVQGELENYHLKCSLAEQSLHTAKQKEKRLNAQVGTKHKSILQKNEKLRGFSRKMKKLRVEIDSRNKIISSLQNELSELTKVKQEHCLLINDFKKLKNDTILMQLKLSYVNKSKFFNLAFSLDNFLAKLIKSKKNNKILHQEMQLLVMSGLFDTDWYESKNPDVIASLMHPVEHYLRFGAAEGRIPSLDFDSNAYLKSYPDVAASGLNPLLHFIKFGKEEGRKAIGRRQSKCPITRTGKQQ